MLWFAFKLVSLNHWKQLLGNWTVQKWVVICFQISIFEPLETTWAWIWSYVYRLWFAFKLVSLNHWKQQTWMQQVPILVVICFQISIFEPLETTVWQTENAIIQLWFAFKLVSLNHWKQRNWYDKKIFLVVICFQISIFEPLETTNAIIVSIRRLLWFAFKLVSLNHWKQPSVQWGSMILGCDLLSN